MQRYILLNQGGGDGGEAVALIEAIEGARIVDRTDGRALLVEASPEAMQRIERDLPGWRATPETRLAKPDPPFPRPSWDLDSREAPPGPSRERKGE